MTDRHFTVMQVNTLDVGGGAELIARQLLEAYRARGIDSKLAVGLRHGADPDVLQIPKFNERGAVEQWLMGQDNDPSPQAIRLAARAGLFTRLVRKFDRRLLKLRRSRALDQGRELDGFGGAADLLRLAGRRPNILHCHNLHGNYFDLAALPKLCRLVPTYLTLHDAWTVSGHCAHSLGCERWLSGCGSCPDLTIYPKINRDATRYNWRRKQAIFRACRLYLTTPCKWLMDVIQRSMVWPGVVASRVIPNGVDQTIFQPGSKPRARAQLGLPSDAKIVVFAANGIKTNGFKDFATLRRAAERIGRQGTRERWLLLALGEELPPERLHELHIEYLPPISDPRRVAAYYQAADLYWHAARADTFPTSVIEALSCGTPVVATAVGGIPEQILAWQGDSPPQRPLPGVAEFFDRNAATGALVGPGDEAALAQATCQILADPSLARQLGDNAARHAKYRFSVERMVGEYLDWYAQSQPAAAQAA